MKDELPRRNTEKHGLLLDRNAKVGRNKKHRQLFNITR